MSLWSSLKGGAWKAISQSWAVLLAWHEQGRFASVKCCRTLQAAAVRSVFGQRSRYSHGVPSLNAPFLDQGLSRERSLIKFPGGQWRNARSRRIFCLRGTSRPAPHRRHAEAYSTSTVAESEAVALHSETLLQVPLMAHITAYSTDRCST